MKSFSYIAGPKNAKIMEIFPWNVPGDDSGVSTWKQSAHPPASGAVPQQEYGCFGGILRGPPIGVIPWPTWIAAQRGKKFNLTTQNRFKYQIRGRPTHTFIVHTHIGPAITAGVRVYWLLSALNRNVTEYFFLLLFVTINECNKI